MSVRAAKGQWPLALPFRLAGALQAGARLPALDSPSRVPTRLPLRHPRLDSAARLRSPVPRPDSPTHLSSPIPRCGSEQYSPS